VTIGLHASAVADHMITFDQPEMVLTFDGLTARPLLSINRHFTAPVIIHQDQSNADRAVLLAHDTDPFNRWDAGNEMVTDLLQRMVTDGVAPDAGYLDGMKASLRDDTLDPAYRAFLLSLPSQSEIAQKLYAAGHTPDPDAIYFADQTLRHALAEHLQDHLAPIYAAMATPGDYSPDADASGKRDLATAMLSLLTRLDGGKQAKAQFAEANNMTQQIASLSVLVREGHGDDALAAFEQQWSEDRLVMNKWFALQIGAASPENAVDVARRLTAHPAFTHTNPNRFRAVFGALAGHHAGFHRPDGAAYELLADWLIKLDPLNPQTTARMVTAFSSLKRYDVARQAKMRAALERIGATPNLSRDTQEMVTRILEG